MIQKFKYNSFDDFRNLNPCYVDKLKAWFAEYNKCRNLNLMDTKLIMIVGENNQLKTSLAEFICSFFNMEMRMLNIQDSKLNRDIKEFILQISNNKNVLNMIYKREDNIGIVIDDFDTLCNNNDKSIITDFLTMFSAKKTVSDFKLLYPIILVSQEVGDKKINELRKISLEINVDRLKPDDYEYYFNRLCAENNITFNQSQKKRILDTFDHDLRKYNNILDDLLLISDGHKIRDENIDLVVNTFSNKTMDDKVSENLEMIFTKELKVSECIDKYYCDKFLFSFLIHENYLYNIGEGISSADKMIFLAKISKHLADNDVIQNLIFEKQLWELNINSAILTNVNTNFLHTQMKKKSKKKITFTKRKYTTLLNKVSLYFTNRKVINQILHKYGNNSNDAFYLSEFLCNCIKRIDKKDFEANMSKYVLPILNKMDITSDNVDLILRLNKLEEESIKKVYTMKYKSFIKNSNA